MAVYVCPLCKGSGRGDLITDGVSKAEFARCIACEGKGIVFDPKPKDEIPFAYTGCRCMPPYGMVIPMSETTGSIQC